MKSIVVVGSSNTDLIIKTERIPAPGETILGGEFFTAHGGKGANQAVAAARLGGQVTFIACIGKDDFGDRSVEQFGKDGIDTSFILRDEKTPSGVALITVDKKGENSIVVAAGSNGALTPEDIRNSASAIGKAGILLVQLEIPIPAVKEAVKAAHDSGATVILNPAPACPLSRDILENVDIITPNETEASILSGIRVTDLASAEKAAEKILEMGVGKVIITMGAEGSYLVTANEKRQFPSIKVNATDTTAAGDAFNGALAYSIARDVPLAESIGFANIVGAVSATRFGAQPSLPTLEEVKNFL